MSRLAWAFSAAWVLTWATPAAAQLFSPGPLSRFHSELEGDDHCSDCHSNGRQVNNRLCLNCHDDLARRVRARAGLHGGEYRGQACAPCHVEHLGRRAPQIRWPGGNKNNFDHDQAGWPLEGAHRERECSDCHNRGRSFLGLRTACVSCHDDEHNGRFDRRCETCHNERTWDLQSRVLQRFDHSLARFPLRGAHGEVECAECHHTPPRWTGLQFRRCSDCHDDPHDNRLGADCASCHQEDRWSHVPRARHPGLRIGGGHRNATCGQCHDDGNLNAPSRGNRCVACHRPVHEAPFGRSCQRCHCAIRWLGLPRRVGLAAHERTGFTLEGAHGEVECTSCHDPELPRDQRFRELEFDRCNSCHQDPHEFAFAGAEGFDCASCHADTGFQPTSFTTALHAQTNYPLTGGHGNVPCSACHGTERPRVSFQVQAQECASCHDNPHGTQFAAEMTRGGCAECHNTAAWNRPNIDHDAWPLTGAHEAAACDSCHSPTEADRSSGSGASYRGVVRECEGCHEDEHLGQFRLAEPVRRCQDCHQTNQFRIERFEHEAAAGYALIGEHENLECSACHPTETLEGGQEVVRYRLGYRECVDCHANPHERRTTPERFPESDAQSIHGTLQPPRADVGMNAWIREMGS